MGKSINCNSVRREFTNFLRVRRKILHGLAADLREELPKKARSNHIPRNHLLCEFLREIIAVLLRSNPSPRDLSVMRKGIHGARRNDLSLVITLAMLIDREGALLLTVDTIGIPKPTNAAASDPCGGHQSNDNLRRTQKVIHYSSLLGFCVD